MASEVGGSDELDGSLFEGMVLFSHSDLLPSGLPREKETDVPSQDPMHPPLDPSPSTASSITYTSPHSKSKPLDEDLFSDLALQIPIEPALLFPVVSSPVPTPSLPAPSRQISRKKKRALRIGYGREAIDMAPVVSVENFPHLTEDATGAVSSDYTSSTADHKEELPDRSVHEEVEASNIAVDVTTDGEGVLPSGSGTPEDAFEVVSSTMDDFQKDENFESMEKKLNLVRSEIYAKLQSIREMAISVYAERKELERRRRKAGQDVNQAVAAYKDLEKQLEEACQDEEFETAEKISECLVTLEKEKARLLDTLRETELDCDSVDSRMQEVLKLHIVAEEEGIESLEQFAKDTFDQAAFIHENADELSSKELDEWQSSMELLELNKLEIDIEVELISDSRSELDSCIEDLVKDERQEIEGLMKKQVSLAMELEELLKLVRLKEAEIAENESRIQEVEKKMSEVASDFQDASSSVSMKHESLKSAMSRIYSERERLSLKKNEIDKIISSAEQRCLTLRGLASVALNEAKTCQDLVGLRKHLASSILESREYKVHLLRTEEKVLEEIQILQQQISNARTSLQELSSNRARIQQEIDSLKQRISFVDKRGPELEAEKKVAAAARNFKEAGRIASEAKSLNSEKENLQHKMEKSVLDLENLEGDIKSTISRMQDDEMLLLLKEREAAVVNFQRLQLIAASASAERSAALESGDSEEGDILSKEIEAAEERVRELQEAYSIDPKDHAKTSKYFFFPVALITKFSEQDLVEMAASLKQPVADE